MYKRILLAVDGSTLSKKAATHAIGLAASTGADLVVMTVVHRYPVAYFEGSITYNANDIGEVEKKWVAEAQARLDVVRSQADAAGVKTRTSVVKSALVAESVIAASRKHKADLIVMASHGRKGIKRLLLGSETQHVLTHSTLPVLVLR